jgi:hypothetical protein
MLYFYYVKEIKDMRVITMVNEIKEWQLGVGVMTLMTALVIFKILIG